MFKDLNEIKSRDESTFSRIATKGIQFLQKRKCSIYIYIYSSHKNHSDKGCTNRLMKGFTSYVTTIIMTQLIVAQYYGAFQIIFGKFLQERFPTILNQLTFLGLSNNVDFLKKSRVTVDYRILSSILKPITTFKKDSFSDFYGALKPPLRVNSFLYIYFLVKLSARCKIFTYPEAAVKNIFQKQRS